MSENSIENELLIHTFSERVIKSSRVVSEADRPYVLRLAEQARVESPDERADRERRMREVDSQARELIRRAQAEREAAVSRAGKEGEGIIAKAREEAERIIAEAQAQRDQVRKEAQKAGREEGYRAAYEEGLAEGKELLSRLNGLFKAAAQERHRVVEEAREGLVEIILHVARRIIKREVADNREIVIANLREALQKVKGSEEIVIRVNPAELEVLEEHREDFGRWVKGLSAVEFKPDTAIEPGGCVVETHFGRVDARIDSQLDEMEKSLRSVMRDEKEMVDSVEQEDGIEREAQIEKEGENGRHEGEEPRETKGDESPS